MGIHCLPIRAQITRREKGELSDYWGDRVVLHRPAQYYTARNLADTAPLWVMLPGREASWLCKIAWMPYAPTIRTRGMFSRRMSHLPRHAGRGIILALENTPEGKPRQNFVGAVSLLVMME
jgi:hypothetical protein